jgi:serine/threonine protein kinase
MTQDGWARVKAIFGSAVELELHSRERYVRDAAGGDQHVYEEVMSLLSADAENAGSDPLFAPHTHAPAESGGSLSTIGARIGPYRLLESIGRGGMGVVYRAYDEKRRRLVALKTLQRTGPTTLYRFKQEFRGFAELSHPNLVSLYELLSDGERWCFTMELVVGRTILAHIAGDAAASRHEKAAALDRLRDGFAQLASGIAALHAADKLHRDLKPSNVLVTSEGRVVVLDFGLGVELDRAGIYQTTDDHVFGSVAYMSPEQATGRAMSVASDWYSVGVMLFQALVGRLPFEGAPLDVIDAKRTRDPFPPSAYDSQVPEDLNALCLDLLRRDPVDRPTESAVLRRLSAHVDRARQPSARPSRVRDVPFVGREAEKAALWDAYEAMRHGSPVIVHVYGSSGAGKSALVHRFLDEVADVPETVVVAGRCLEQESVPFKALDSLIDSLARHLRQLSPVELQAVMPRDIRALARVFPVLWQISAAAEAPAVGPNLADPQELRRRAAAALRELLARLGDRHPLVLFIDDLHWGDMDSASLLTDILTPPDAPVFLGIGTYRSEDVSTSAFFNYLQESRQRAPRSYDERELTLGSLAAEETRELTYRLLKTGDGRADALVGAIVEESAGRPFLVYELIEHVKASADGLELARPLTLDEVLWRRIEGLPAESRRLLEVVAVAGRPIETSAACRAAGVTTDDRVLLPALRAGRFIRGTTGTSERLETYHDRVRQSVVAHLPATALQTHHRRLAETFSASRTVDAEVLALHLNAAGESEEAAVHYARAAAAAANALAFDHAAALYRRALELKAWNTDERCRLGTQLGDALSNAGRGADAAAEYLAAAPHANAIVGLELQRRAALALLTTGHVDEGLTCLGPLLKSAGTHLAGAPWRALVSLLARRVQLRLRGTAFVERAEDTIAPEALQRIDIGWSVVIGLSVIDPIRGADFQTRSLLLALRAGEPFRVARALAVEAGHLASSGDIARAREILGEADRLARRLQRPYTMGMVELARGTVGYFDERWKDALASCWNAAATFREHCTGATWEIDTAEAFSLWSLAKMGEIGELNRVCPPLLKEAHERGDLYAIANLSTQIMALVRLAADDPAWARDELTRVMKQWSQNGYHVQHHDALLAFVPLELYCGNPGAAWGRVRAEWSAFRWSLLSHVQDLRIEMLQLRAYCALAMATKVGDPDTFLGIAAADARRLRRERLPWTTALAEYVSGTCAAIRGDAAAARERLAAAVAAFDRVDAHLHAAATRRRLGHLIGGHDGRGLRDAADAWFRAQGIKVPERMVAAYAPGFKG